MKFHYYTAPTDKNRVSVAGEFNEGVLKIAVARTSNRDSFCREKGRTIAEGRLAKGRTYKSIAMEVCEGKDFLKVVAPIAEEVRIKGVYSEEQPPRIIVKNQFKALAKVK